MPVGLGRTQSSIAAIWIWATGWSATRVSARAISTRDTCATCIAAIPTTATSGCATGMSCFAGGAARLISVRGEQRSRTAVSAETHGTRANVQTLTAIPAAKRPLDFIGCAFVRVKASISSQYEITPEFDIRARRYKNGVSGGPKEHHINESSLGSMVAGAFKGAGSIFWWNWRGRQAPSAGKRP